MKRSAHLILLTTFALSAPLLAQPTPEAATSPTLTRNEAFRKIQSEVNVRQALEKTSDDLDAKRFDAALARIEALPADVRDSNPSLLNARGAALVQLDRIDEASAAFNQVLQIDPTFFPARFNIGEILFQQGKYAEAATHFRTMINNSGENPLIKFKVYLSYLLSDNEVSAEYALRNIRFPLDGPAWYFAQAASEARQGNNRKARELSATGRELHPDDSVSYVESLEDSQLLP